ncbi:transposase-like protein [Spirosoma sp. LMG 31448]|uniref:Transposase-like protein n=2 Tax=Spirosoma utsteinense TaxID=2585773 RepID=A0ABR6WFM5_9BACT|nr:transposase [Spirosoma utsteinense]MBC3788859.1 transposase-like protein [Spirosoma utsteinense]MBC3794800.1 transposase-like protein [Spirosoma utsteinense]
MSKIRRSFTPEDRYSIVQEAIRDGHAETSRKYNLSPSLLRRWRLKYLSKGKEGLKDSYARLDPQLRALEPGRFLWFKQGLAYNFCHIFCPV